MGWNDDDDDGGDVEDGAGRVVVGEMRRQEVRGTAGGKRVEITKKHMNSLNLGLRERRAKRQVVVTCRQLLSS